MSKGARDMVTDADFAVEKLIKERLLTAFPHDAYLGEETGHVKGGEHSGIWVVDPIDETQPFLSGFSTWCISIAYVQANDVLLGMVNNPAAGELFIGGAGRAAELNGRPIAPRDAQSLAEGLTYLGCNPRLGPEQVVPVVDRLLRAGGMFLRNGSGARGLCDIACGRLIGYVEAHINPWDCLGAIGVCRSAGVRVNDYLSETACSMAAPLSRVRLRCSISSSPYLERRPNAHANALDEEEVVIGITRDGLGYHHIRTRPRGEDHEV